jgi:ankyrin repeat protein
MLIDYKADVNLTSSVGATVLFLVCQRGFSDIIKLLIEAGADCNLAENDGVTPLMGATYKCDNIEIFKMLIGAGADLFAIDKRGHTALEHASFFGRVEVVTYLLSIVSFNSDILEKAFKSAKKNKHNEVAGLINVEIKKLEKAALAAQKARDDAAKEAKRAKAAAGQVCSFHVLCSTGDQH